MLLYNLSIRFYYLIIILFSPFNKKAKLFISGRKNNWEKLNEIDSRNIIWFHCASLGEFDQGIPVMNLIKHKEPNVKILVTFFSPSGMEHYHKRKHCADYVFYLPIDTPSNAKKFLEKTNPKAVYFVKYEFWLNYIFEAKKKNIPLYSISCILRKEQHFFKPQGYYFRKGLRSFNIFFVQNEETKQLLNSIKITNAVITGDTRYDKVLDNKKSLTEDANIKSFLKDDKAIILGSSWPIEETIFHEAFKTGKITEKIIIAPHDISEAHLKQIEQLFPNKTLRYSNFENHNNQQILLIDCIGKLANAYQYGKFAFIGGGFTGSLHNTLEPIVFGLPVVFGPKHSKFPEADLFIKKGVARNTANKEELLLAIQHFDKNKEFVTNVCESIIKQSKGASEKIVSEIYK